MKKLILAVLAIAAFALAQSAFADTLELKNGSVIKGTFIGGSAAQLSFRVGSTVQHYAVGDVAVLRFDGDGVPSNTGYAPSSQSNYAPPAQPNYPPPQTSNTASTQPNYAPPAQSNYPPPSQPNYAPPANSPAVAGDRVTVPTGTRLSIRTIDAIDSDRNRVGDKFAATLEQPLYVGDQLVAPKGTNVYGRLEEAKQAGQLAGKAQLRLSLTGIVINGQTYGLSTGDYELSGKSRTANTAAKVGGGAALGAVIGAIAGGGKGAAIGAGVGAGAGTAVQVATKGDQVHVPSETLLEFSLDQPVTIPIAQ
ncbi:MAG TPA: hypothetical protein VIB39_05760 [Candidatus Angelobacter sp.]